VSTPQLSGFFASAASHTQHAGGNSVYTPGPLQTGHASVRLLTIPVQIPVLRRRDRTSGVRDRPTAPTDTDIGRTQPKVRVGIGQRPDFVHRCQRDAKEVNGGTFNAEDAPFTHSALARRRTNGARPTASAARSRTSFAASPVWIDGSACTAAVVSWQGNVESIDNNGRTPWSD